MKIRRADGPEDVALARELIEAYVASLGVDLSFQGFDEEVANLPGSYAPPQGRLLLALVGGEAAGCVALRPQEGGFCEMKRLYVRPEFRGQNVGKRLAQRIIEEARSIGYVTMRLDTLPFMRSAIPLYETLGFVRSAAYYETPISGTIFMELRLQARIR